MEYTSVEDVRKEFNPEVIDGIAGRLVQTMESHRKIWSLIKEYKPLKYLEIGSQHGFSASIAASANKDMHLYLFDWAGNGNGGHTTSADFLKYHMEKFAEKRHTITFGDTQSAEISQKIIDGGPYDFVFIDGDHSYAGARHDFDTVLRCISDKAIIIFDDTSNPGHAVDLTKLYHEMVKEIENIGLVKTELIKIDDPLDVGLGYYIIDKSIINK
jgi:predicted O-methyltransferase YrrM